MTCHEADPWMLSARTADDLPERVRRHLTECSQCATRFDLLARVEVAATQLAPPANRTGRARLDARVAQALQQPARHLEPATRDRRFPRWAVGLAAAVLLTGGWLVGRLGTPKPVAQVTDPPRPEERHLPVAPRPAPAPGLLVKTARHSSQVAANPDPAAQLDALGQIAADLRADAVKRAEAGDVEQLPRLVGLHKRVLKHGVDRQLRRVPESKRAATANQAADELDRSIGEVTAAAGRLPPAVGDLLRPLVVSCQTGGAALRQRQSALTADDWPAPATPLESLVAQTIRLADADTPLTRADEAAQLAAVLSQVIAVLSVADLPDDAARVGETLDTVLGSGVAANLERVEGADPAGTSRDEVAKVRERAARATEALERNLAKAPPAARVGLERAIAASDPGRGKATGKEGPGKPPGGPPWKKGDGEHPGKGGTPPGWQKKP